MAWYGATMIESRKSSGAVAWLPSRLRGWRVFVERVSWRKSEGTARRLVSLDDFEVPKCGFTIALSRKQLVQNALSHPRAVAFHAFPPSCN
jgi:hypothetical protein